MTGASRRTSDEVVDRAGPGGLGVDRVAQRSGAPAPRPAPPRRSRRPGPPLPCTSRCARWRGYRRRAAYPGPRAGAGPRGVGAAARGARGPGGGAVAGLPGPPVGRHHARRRRLPVDVLLAAARAGSPAGTRAPGSRCVAPAAVPDGVPRGRHRRRPGRHRRRRRAGRPPPRRRWSGWPRCWAASPRARPGTTASACTSGRWSTGPTSGATRLPLRLGAAGTDAVVEALPLRCSHVDAFRFFTDEAVPRNASVPTRATPAGQRPRRLRARRRWTCSSGRSKLGPLAPGPLLLDCFELARDARTLDMRASPYDVSGLRPRRRAGRDRRRAASAYAAQQRVLAARAAPLRERLLEVCRPALGARSPVPGSAGDQGVSR